MNKKHIGSLMWIIGLFLVIIAVGGNAWDLLIAYLGITLIVVGIDLKENR